MDRFKGPRGRTQVNANELSESRIGSLRLGLCLGCVLFVGEVNESSKDCYHCSV